MMPSDSNGYFIGPNISHCVQFQINSIKIYSRYRQLGLSFQLDLFHFSVSFPYDTCPISSLWRSFDQTLTFVCIKRILDMLSTPSNASGISPCCHPQRLTGSDGARSQAQFPPLGGCPALQEACLLVKTDHRVT